MRYAGGLGAATRLVLLGAGLLGLAACDSVPSFDQIQANRFDMGTLVPPNPTQFAPKERIRTPVSPTDLVSADGTCADMGPAASAAPPEQKVADAAPDAAAVPPAVPHAVALEMSECEVVRAAGRPSQVQIGANESGERTVTMIYDTPEHPTYRFVAGRLKVMEGNPEPPPAPKPVKKKPAKRAARSPAT